MRISDHFRNVMSACATRLHPIRIMKRFFTHEDLWNIFHCTVESVMEYAAPLFGRLKRDIVDEMSSLYKRCKRIVCPPSCSCDNVPLDIQSHRDRVALKLLHDAEVNESHPLHSLVPSRHRFCNKYVVPCCFTERRRNTFIIYTVLKANNS